MRPIRILGGPIQMSNTAMPKSTDPRQVSRRTLMKGAAWAVPVLAVAATSPLAAASGNVPPAPGIDFGGGCGNTGATKKGCGGSQTLQVPLTLSNNTGRDIVFQVVSMYTCNCGTAPTAAGPGVYSGVRGIFKTPTFGIPQNDCTAVPDRPVGGTVCAGGTANGTILVPDGTTDQKYWIESAETGSSSTFSATISWRMLDAETCEVLQEETAKSLNPLSPANCSDK